LIDLRVIAVGSPFTGDDLAWQVSDTLQQQFDTIDFIKLDRPGSQLIEYLQGVDRVVVIDALEEKVTSSIVELTMQQLQQETNLVSSHGFGVSETLRLAEAMQALPETLCILGLSPGVDIHSLADRCAAIIASYTTIHRQQVSRNAI